MSLLQDPNTKNEYRNNEVCRKYLGSGGMFHFLPFGNSWYLCPLNQLKLKILHTFIGNGKVVMVQDRRANIFIFENRRLSNKIKEISFLNLKKPFKRSSMYFPKCVPSPAKMQISGPQESQGLRSRNLQGFFCLFVQAINV